MALVAPDHLLRPPEIAVHPHAMRHDLFEHLLDVRRHGADDDHAVQHLLAKYAGISAASYIADAHQDGDVVRLLQRFINAEDGFECDNASKSLRGVIANQDADLLRSPRAHALGGGAGAIFQPGGYLANLPRP